VVRSKEQLCASWLPLFFGQSKFSSFTRKLYRWGFRKINMASHTVGGSHANAYFFGNENFQRDKMELLSLMKSVTAAKTRCELAADAAKHTWIPSHNQGSNVSGERQHESHATFQANNQGQSSTSLNISQPQSSLPVGTGVTAMDQAALIQQAVNLAALQSLLATPQVGLAASQVAFAGTQSPAPNPFMDDGLLRLISVPPNAPQAPPFDYHQMLRQFAYSAALVAAAGTMNQALPQQAPQPQAQAQAQAPAPWWTNPAVQAALPNQLPQQLQGQQPGQSIPEQVQPVVPNEADQERLRGVIDMFLRYSATQQQQNQQQNQPSEEKTPQSPPDPRY
jgi:HSF-type DNA-binding